jgi:flagellar hook assembly protein FlgD
MKRLFLLAAMFGLLTIPRIGTGQTSGWSLSQDDPDPLCAMTRILYTTAQAGHVQLSVWNAEQTAILKHLVDMNLPAGIFAYTWDGRDDQGAKLPNGQYPYRLVVQGDGVTLFDASHELRIQCDVGPIPVPPPGWSLGQNDPDPLCNSTRILFSAAQDAHVQFAVWNPDRTAIIRLLVDMNIPAGVHAVSWDGHDDGGLRVPNGEYPYRLVAQAGGTTVFDSSLVLRIQCDVAADERTWGALKTLYRP